MKAAGRCSQMKVNAWNELMRATPSHSSTTMNSDHSQSSDSLGEAWAQPTQVAGVVGDEWMTMKSQLQAIQQEDPSKVFIVRDIKRLGFDSSEHLWAYFSAYGEVAAVHVSHSRTKSARSNSRQVWRLRAATVGFVVMATPEAVENCIAMEHHLVSGQNVRVHKYLPNSISPSEGRSRANTFSADALEPTSSASCVNAAHQIWDKNAPAYEPIAARMASALPAAPPTEMQLEGLFKSNMIPPFGGFTQQMVDNAEEGNLSNTYFDLIRLFRSIPLSTILACQPDVYEE